ncbi:synaptotagmin-7-like [Antedon mediterranea]|uniref:synaptotagmin-7-like n=1 Tax=Antedon mediterranea TaxID=105859 RepID=UPI003AF915E1
MGFFLEAEKDGVSSFKASETSRLPPTIDQRLSLASPPQFIIPLQPMTQRAPVVIDTLTTRSTRDRALSDSSNSSLGVTPVRIANESTLLTAAVRSEDVSNVGTVTRMKLTSTDNTRQLYRQSTICEFTNSIPLPERTCSVPMMMSRRQQLYRVPSGVTASFRAFAPSMEDLRLTEGTYPELCFAIDHFPQEEKLRIVIDKATRIQMPDKHREHFKQPMVFVKGSVLPGKQKKFKTKNSPISNAMTDVDWQEVFDLEGISFSSVWQITILLEVYIRETSGRGRYRVGVCELPLENIDLSTRQAFVMTLEESTPEPEFGDLHLSIVYQPNALRVVMYIAEARDLPKPTASASISVGYFVKIELFHYQTRLEKKRTKMVKISTRPKWADQLVFLVPPGNVNMNDVRFVVTLMSKDMMKNHHAIAKVELGWDTSCEELEYWTDVVNNHNRPIAQWLTLQNPNDYR